MGSIAVIVELLYETIHHYRRAHGINQPPLPLGIYIAPILLVVGSSIHMARASIMIAISSSMASESLGVVAISTPH